jgi:Flp pilus assembly protein TadB
MELWFVAAGLFLIWFVLSALLQKGGMVHVILLSAIAVFVVQVAAYRKAKHHNRGAGR